MDIRTHRTENGHFQAFFLETVRILERGTKLEVMDLVSSAIEVQAWPSLHCDHCSQYMVQLIVDGIVPVLWIDTENRVVGARYGGYDREISFKRMGPLMESIQAIGH